MIDIVKDTAVLWEQRPFNPEQTILVGVSGGADSIALLHYILDNQLHPRDKVVAVHVNHQLRDTAQREAAFVADIAQKWGVQSSLKVANVTQIQEQEKVSSIEEAAREGRYRAFEEAAAEYHTPFVLVAHHADDQVETVLMNLLRGSGLAGLSGMKVVTSLNSLILFRPFLNVWRSDIEAYCQSEQLPYIKDESNQDQSLQRNRLRHELIPLLTSYNEQAKEHIVQTAQIVQADAALLQQTVQQYWSAAVVQEDKHFIRFKKHAWRTLPVSAQRLMLRQAIRALCGSLRDISFDALETVREVMIGGVLGAEASVQGIWVRVEYKEIIVYLSYSHPSEVYDLPLLPEKRSYSLTINEKVTLSGKWIIAAVVLGEVDLAIYQQNKNPWQCYLAVEENTALHLRPREPGERFQPLGMEGTAKVKDVMINEKIPAAVRDYWPIVADQSGLLWLAGHRQAQRTAVTPASQRVIYITIRKEIRA